MSNQSADKDVCGSRTLELPKQVSAFLSKQTPAISRGLEHIAALQTDADFEKLDVYLDGTEQAIRIVRGYLLRAYKEQVCDPRKFSEFLNKRGISRRTAYDYLDEAAVFDRLKDENACEMIAVLGSTKVRALKHLDDDELNGLANGEPVRGMSRDEIESLTAKDLAQNLIVPKDELESYADLKKQLEAKIAQLETEKDTAEARQAKLEANLDMRRDDRNIPGFYEVTREESRALTQKIEMCLDDLHSLVQEEFQRSRSPELSDEVREYADNALGTLFIHITGLAGRFTKLGHAMEQSLGREITENMGSELRYSPAEAAEVVARHETLMAEHRLAAQSRADARAEKKKKGPGRPKKKA